MDQESHVVEATPGSLMRRRWGKRLAVGVGFLAGVWVAVALVIWGLSPEPVAQGQVFDAIIVLGAGCNEEGMPDRGLDARVRKGVALYQARTAPVLILTGGAGPGAMPESRCAKKLALMLGVPDGAIMTEEASRNTMGNARESRALTPAQRVVLVSSGYHGYRAGLIFRKFFKDVAFEPCDWEGVGALWGVLREPLGLAALAVRPDPGADSRETRRDGTK